MLNVFKCTKWKHLTSKGGGVARSEGEASFELDTLLPQLLRVTMACTCYHILFIYFILVLPFLLFISFIFTCFMF